METPTLEHFLATFFYAPETVLLEGPIVADPDGPALEARMDTTRPLALTAAQRGDEATHPRHVSGPDLVLLTGNLGCLFAYWMHGVRWDEGWVGFGNRIHRADFKDLARIGPPLRLRCEETRSRVGPERVLLRYLFRFEQEGRVVYLGDQTAQFFKGRPLAAGDD